MEMHNSNMVIWAGSDTMFSSPDRNYSAFSGNLVRNTEVAQGVPSNRGPRVNQSQS